MRRGGRNRDLGNRSRGGTAHGETRRSWRAETVPQSRVVRHKSGVPPSSVRRPSKAVDAFGVAVACPTEPSRPTGVPSPGEPSPGEQKSVGPFRPAWKPVVRSRYRINVRCGQHQRATFGAQRVVAGANVAGSRITRYRSRRTSVRRPSKAVDAFGVAVACPTEPSRPTRRTIPPRRASVLPARFDGLGSPSYGYLRRWWRVFWRRPDLLTAHPSPHHIAD